MQTSLENVLTKSPVRLHSVVKIKQPAEQKQIENITKKKPKGAKIRPLEYVSARVRRKRRKSKKEEILSNNLQQIRKNTCWKNDVKIIENSSKQKKWSQTSLKTHEQNECEHLADNWIS